MMGDLVRVKAVEGLPREPHLVGKIEVQAGPGVAMITPERAEEFAVQLKLEARRARKIAAGAAGSI